MLVLKSTSATFLAFVSKRILNSPMDILKGSSKAELYFRGIESLTKAGKLPSSRIWALALQLWKRLKLLTFMVLYLVMPLK